MMGEGDMEEKGAKGMEERKKGIEGWKKGLRNWKKGLLLGGLVWMLMILGAAAALAQTVMELDGTSGKRVYDMAELLDEEEEEELESQIAEKRKELGFDIVIVTRSKLSLSEGADGKSPQEYADDCYDEGGFGSGSDKDGILFLIDMENRELVLSTAGKAIRIFTDQRIETMLDHVYEGASEGDFEASAAVFLEDVEYYGKKGIPSGQYNYDTETGKVSVYKSIRWYEALLAVGVSAFVAGMACLNVKRQYAMEDDPQKLRNLNMAYRADCRFAYDNQNDQLVNKFVTSRVIPRNTGSSSGGRSSGGHSFGGRSSTHHSSSGRSHGGGSRRF